MGQTFELAGETFTTQKAVPERCQRILHSGVPIEGQAHAFLLALLGRHPEAAQKIGVGVQRLYVQSDGRTRTGVCFWLERTDGTITEWSFLACIKPPTHKVEVTSALRTLVEPQIRAFRARAFGGSFSVPCALTGTAVAMGESHVDHTPPVTFDALVQAFLDSRGLTMGEVAVVPTADASAVNTLVDVELAHAWVEYHELKASLRVTSKGANLSQGAKLVTDPR
jgi:hypothetical protein